VLSDKGQVQVVVSGGICKRTTGEGTDVVRRLLVFLWSCHSVADAHPVFPKKAGFSTVFGTVTMLQPNIISGWPTLMTQGEDPNGPPQSYTTDTIAQGGVRGPLIDLQDERQGSRSIAQAAAQSHYIMGKIE
jgi:hypothetical protein